MNASINMNFNVKLIDLAVSVWFINIKYIILNLLKEVI